jgi:ketosteroid isomerase-like protein
MAESVGLALLVVLNRLAPAERLAFVLHDMFAMPFDEIAPIVGRSTSAAKKLASRARHRIQGTTGIPSADLTRQRQVVDAFLAALRSGDINAILAVLDPDVVRRADHAAVPAGTATEVRGAQAVAKETLTNSQRARFAQPALVNGALGIVVVARGQLHLALTLTIRDEKITEIDVIADPVRLHQLDLAVLDS